MKLAQALRQCAQIEGMIGEAYDRFATIWPESSLCAFWRGFAGEERQHGHLLELAADNCPETREETLDAGRIAEVRGTARGLLAIAPRSLDEAFRVALDLEGLEIEQIYRRIMALVGDLPEVQRPVAATLAGIAHHEEPLLDVVERHATDPALRAEAGRLRSRITRDAALESRPIGLPKSGIRRGRASRA